MGLICINSELLLFFTGHCLCVRGGPRWAQIEFLSPVMLLFCPVCSSCSLQYNWEVLAGAAAAHSSWLHVFHPLIRPAGVSYWKKSDLVMWVRNITLQTQGEKKHTTFDAFSSICTHDWSQNDHREVNTCTLTDDPNWHQLGWKIPVEVGSTLGQKIKATLSFLCCNCFLDCRGLMNYFRSFIKVEQKQKESVGLLFVETQEEKVKMVWGLSL